MGPLRPFPFQRRQAKPYHCAAFAPGTGGHGDNQQLDDGQTCSQLDIRVLQVSPA